KNLEQTVDNNLLDQENFAPQRRFVAIPNSPLLQSFEDLLEFLVPILHVPKMPLDSTKPGIC
ncbi:hypothetical protein KJ032_27125, partial [Salmonella enterica subsp. enterica serovar Typhimurium]|nr:hypothetical protein [Salmonella enterica subsp. enterica serovar Typhimurium]